jgi:hypothetical protein
VPTSPAPRRDGQLGLLAAEEDRDDHIDVIVCDLWGRVLDAFPAHLGAREPGRDRPSLHEATLWAHLAIRDAGERLPPPTWATLPGHDPCAGRLPP